MPFSQNSKYTRNSVKYIDNNNKLQVWYRRPTIEQHSTDEVIMVEAGELMRPDKIANRMYGKPNLSWVIILTNQIFDIREFYVGRQLRIPKLERIQGFIL